MTGVAAIFPKVYFTNANGMPVVGGKLYSYLAGTTTPTPTWTDQSLSFYNTNPVVLDAAGACVVWLDSTVLYKFVLADANGVILWSQDNISGVGPDPSVSLATAVLSVYQGAQSSNPSTRPGGEPLQNGDLYFNTNTNRMMAYANGVWYATETEGATDAALVSYTPAGTGAIPTSVENKLRESVSILDFGAVGDGVTDNTTALNNAFDYAKQSSQSILLTDGEFNIAGDVVIDNVMIIGNGVITGSGTLRGVVLNDNVPFENIRVWNNIVTVNERSNFIESGDIYLDPLLGDDANTGLSDAEPVQSISQALVVLQSLLPTYTTDIRIICRSGRIEMPQGGLTIGASDSFSGSNTDVWENVTANWEDYTKYPAQPCKAQVTWVKNSNEQPTFTPKTYWVFKNNAEVAIQNGHKIVANDYGEVLWHMYRGDTKQQVKLAKSYKTGLYALPRNQQPNVGYDNTGGVVTLTIRPESQHLSMLSQLSSAELASIRVRLTQWYTSSWHVEDFTINSDGTLSFRGYVTTSDLYNGFNYITGGSPCPYLLINVPGLLEDDTFCCTDTTITLPSNDCIAWFYAEKLDKPLQLTGCVGHNFEIGMSYTHGTDATYAASYTSGNFDIRGIDGTGASYVSFSNAKFESNDGNALIVSPTVTRVVNNTFVNSGAYSIDYPSTTGGDYATIEDNYIDGSGTFLSISGIGISQTGTDVNIINNTIKDSAWAAIRVNSRLQGTGTAGDVSGTIYNNYCEGVGVISGKPAELVMALDTGVFVTNDYGEYAPYSVVGNVFVNGNAFAQCRGWFGDDATRGKYFSGNLIFKCKDPSIYVRNVALNNGTGYNLASGNILAGLAYMQSVDNTSVYASNIAVAVNSNANVAQNGNFTVDPSVALASDSALVLPVQAFLPYGYLNSSLKLNLSPIVTQYLRKTPTFF